MKTKALLAIVTAVLVSACAHTGQPGRMAVVDSHVAHTEIDAERVARVERAAARSGVRVVWVNAPRRAPR